MQARQWVSRALLSSLARHELGFASAVHLTTPRTEPRKDYNNMGARPRRIGQRCDTVAVMFWQSGFDDTDAMMGVRYPLTSTGAVRICTDKTE